MSKQVIKRWLENYEAMSVGETPQDAPPSNSGPKNYDGISGGQLNKIMLDQAISLLAPVKRACIEAKYVERLPIAITTKALGISYDVYSHRVKAGIDDIYHILNKGKEYKKHIKANHKNLIKKILDI